MNTWIVGRVPISHHVRQPYNHPEDSNLSTPGEKTFFLKARIMAGQANLEGNLFGLEDFRWVTKQEVGRLVAAKLWSSVRNALGDR
jgi:large subunit ribosomal protein L46